MKATHPFSSMLLRLCVSSLAVFLGFTALSQAATPTRLPLPAFPLKGNTMDTRALIRHAIQHNQTLRRIRQRIHVYKQRETRTGPWPDLQIGVSATNFPIPSFNPTDTGMSGIIYSISQRFPVPKRLALKKQLAALDTAMLQAYHKEQTVWIAYRIRKSLYTLHFLKESLRIERELYRLMKQAAAIAHTRYTVNQAPQQHYLQAYSQQATIRSRMIGLRAKTHITVFRLRRQLGPKSQRQIGSLPRTQRALPLLTAARVRQFAYQQRGTSQRWKLAAKQAQQLLSLARLSYWPNITVQLSVRQRFPNPMDKGLPFLSLGVKIPIPSGGNASRHGFVQEAMSRHLLARSQMREWRIRLREQIRIAFVKINQYKQQRTLLTQQSIPLALQTYRSALRQYQVNKVDFLTLLTNLQQLFREKRKLARLTMATNQQIARLHAIAGQLFPRAGQPAPTPKPKRKRK
jgi:outer membrane protein TolC